MKKQTAIELVNAKWAKVDELDRLDEWQEELNSMHKQLEKLSDDEILKCEPSFNDLRTFLSTYKPKQSKTTKNTNKSNTYLALIVPVASATEKAIGIVVGTNNKSGINYKEYTQWIPLSQMIEQDEKFYIPTWIVANNQMWHVVNKEDKIVK